MTLSTDLYASPTGAGKHRIVPTGIPWTAIVFLGLTAVISLLWSHSKLMWNDEFLSLWTDNAPSIGQVIQIQRSCPISLDPLFYHALAHASIRFFGSGALAIRLPSLLGYLLMQLCLFLFVRRVASERSAVFAMAFPALTISLYYSVEGRPYGLMLGLFALTMVSWQSATRREKGRTPALILLAVSLALTLNTHYYGVLLLAPLSLAEIFRAVQRRRLDLPVVASIGLGTAGILFTIPFMKAAALYHSHYYNVVADSPRTIAQVYPQLLSSYSRVPTQFDGEIGRALFLLLAFVTLLGCIRQWCAGTLKLPQAEAVFLIALAALPFFGFLLARFVTHALELRFVLGAILGITALAAIGLSSFFSRKRAGNLALFALFAAIALSGFKRICEERTATRETISSMTVSPALKAALLAGSDRRLYFEQLKLFAVASYYEPDPELRAAMALTFSSDQELRAAHANTNSLTVMNMRRFTHFIIVPYDTLATQPGEPVFVTFHQRSDNWVPRTTANTFAPAKYIGSAFGGDAESIRFLP
jgi:hypothetical protein